MRIRRNILAPAILTVGTIGSLVAGPVLALTTAAAPAASAVAVSATPNTSCYTTGKLGARATARRRFPQSAAGRLFLASPETERRQREIH